MDSLFKTQIILVLLLVVSALFFPPKNEELLYQNSLLEKEEVRLYNIRQLTFSGENAEAYFSANGKRLIFQSHDGDSSCDQIYVMDIASRQAEMVSTGNGVTTCSYFGYPDCNNIIYASTHLANKACPEKPDYSKGYVWKLYPGYDIFMADLNGSIIGQLTNSPGYDAEATVAFNGSKIIYTSIMSGDLEVWSMDKDGSNKKQLTDRLGYDGGAFVNMDATKIVWRVYHPKTEKEIGGYRSLLSQNSIRPMALQIWTMNTDGSNKTQITDNNAENFGPYFFPGGNKIIFSPQKLYLE